MRSKRVGSDRPYDPTSTCIWCSSVAKPHIYQCKLTAVVLYYCGLISAFSFAICFRCWSLVVAFFSTLLESSLLKLRPDL
jgi:hypothetical protein